MFSYHTEIRVRYGDTDQMGYVYYGNYAYFFEIARAEAFRSLGLPYAALEAEGVMMPVTRMQQKFIGAALYDELLHVELSIPQLPGRIIQFNYQIKNSKGKLIHEASTDLAFVQKSSGKVIMIPDSLKKLLQPFFQI